MIEIYILTEVINREAEKEAELIGKEYEPKLEYTKSWINPQHIEVLISQSKEDLYIIQLATSEGEITAKISKDEVQKLVKG